MFLGPRNTSDLISTVSFTCAMRCRLFRLVSAPFTSFCLAKFGWLPFADVRVQRLATKQNAEFTKGVLKVWSYLLVCTSKFITFWDNVGYLLYLSKLLPDCLYHFWFKRYSPLSLEVVENRTNCKVFWPPIF